MEVKKRIVTARRTVYSLMAAGLHGLNGVNPYVAIHMIQMYVIPRLIYGLNVIKHTKFIFISKKAAKTDPEFT